MDEIALMDAQLAQFFVNGISVGSIIALSAVGLTLTYGILRLSNFAHGDFMTLGAYLTFLGDRILVNQLHFDPNWSVWLAMLGAATLTVGAALLSEKLLWALMRQKRATSTTLIIISIGLSLFLRNGIILIWGGGNQRYELPIVEAINLLGVRLPFYNLIVIALAITTIAALHYLLQNTKIGKAMRAVADDIDLARVTGINVDRVIIWTWIIAASLTALGGSMLGLVEAVRPNMGWFLILPLFASVILGGIGNPYGAIAGALIIGVAQEVGTYFYAMQPVYFYFLRPEYKQGVALLIMVIVLLVRPQGLFKGTL